MPDAGGCIPMASLHTEIQTCCSGNQTCGVHESCEHLGYLWELACQRWRWVRQQGGAAVVASSLASQLPQVLRGAWILWTPAIPAGASLLAMAVGQATEMLAVLASSLASQLLQVLRGAWILRATGIPVGAAVRRLDLPAMAVGQATEMLAVLASSLASQLPQFSEVYRDAAGSRESLWEPACWRWRWLRQQLWFKPQAVVSPTRCPRRPGV